MYWLNRSSKVGVNQYRMQNDTYQVVLLHPYFASPVKRLVKAPKLYWVDPGLWRHQTGQWGEADGHLLETYVVGECIKWIRTTGVAAASLPISASESSGSTPISGPCR